MKVGIIGLGYVGLPLACLCSKKGYEVIGIDINPDVVKKTNKKISHIKDDILEKEIKNANIKATTNPEIIKECNIIIICVPTPVDERCLPNLEPLKNSVESITPFIKNDQIIIVESTIYPGTIEEIVKPILEKSGLKAEKDFYLAHCPERIDPGNKKWTIEKIPRNVGAVTKEGAKKAADFYRSIIDAEILELNSVKAAEATKIMENTFRDINIAFVNEMAKSFDKLGVDILEVIKGAASKPFAFMPHYPGAGVGGHCISIDPYYLIAKAESIGFEHKFLSLARKINKSMPKYTVRLLQDELNKLQKSISKSKVGVLGLAYKKNVDDTRESPSFEIIEILKELGAEIFVFDPFVLNKSDVKDLNELLEKVEHIILVTDHNLFKEMDITKLKENNIQVVIDGRNCLNKEAIKRLGINYKGIGR